jgi:3-(3-hydroxy-phenyl)propionate hydroxylase
VLAQRGQAPAGLKTLLDSKGRLAQRYDLQPGTTYLRAPTSTWPPAGAVLTPPGCKAAVARATGNA